LKRIALYSQRFLAAKGQILVKDGDVLTHLIVVVSGEAHYIRGGLRQVVGRDKEVGLEDLMSEGSLSSFFLSCITDCELVLVPRAQAVRIYKLRYRLDERESVQYKSRRATEYSVDKTPRK
jgi:CRP-like cAMP-binding protein